MKKLLILMLVVTISSKINAQNISSNKYQNQFIKEDFNQNINNKILISARWHIFTIRVQQPKICPD